MQGDLFEWQKVTADGGKWRRCSQAAIFSFLTKTPICQRAICSLRVRISMIPHHSEFTLVSPLRAPERWHRRSSVRGSCGPPTFHQHWLCLECFEISNQAVTEFIVYVAPSDWTKRFFFPPETRWAGCWSATLPSTYEVRTALKISVDPQRLNAVV